MVTVVIAGIIYQLTFYPINEGLRPWDKNMDFEMDKFVTNKSNLKCGPKGMERTYGMIKPGAVKAGYIENIIDRIREEDFFIEYS